MGNASREEIVDFLNVLLEAERAGARVMLMTTVESAEPELRALAASIHHDEARWCGVLFAAIKRLDGEPSLGTGAFYEKAMAIVDLRMRLALLNRGQEWVAGKLREMLPKIKDEELYGRLSEMLGAHERNIEKVARSGFMKV
jgi:nitronate monooxygenase